MTILIINKIGENEKASDFRWADFEIREQFYPSCQYVSEFDKDWENREIKDFLEKMSVAGCEVDYDKQTFRIPDEINVIDKILQTWMNTDKLNEELDSCDRSATGFLDLLKNLKYWIEYESALPAVVDGMGYETVIQAIEDMDKEKEYTVCQALYMKA